jgi:hypothetical protein
MPCTSFPLFHYYTSLQPIQNFQQLGPCIHRVTPEKWQNSRSNEGSVSSSASHSSGTQFRPLFNRSFLICLFAIRPEKDHTAQLHTLRRLFSAHPEYLGIESNVKLILLGGSRNAGDAARVESLHQLAKELGVEVCSSSP